jgi:hypothetical protein
MQQSSAERLHGLRVDVVPARLAQAAARYD